MLNAANPGTFASNNPVRSAARGSSSVSCSHCRLNALCLPLALENDEIHALDELVQRGRPLHKGEHLYQAGDSFGTLYAVRSGALKTYRLSPDGREQITGFHLPGEVLGLDGIGSQWHSNSAKALETTAVCAIPFERLGELGRHLPNMQRHLMRLLGQEINHEQEQSLLLSQYSAAQRIVALLLSLSARHARQQLSAQRFRLPMSRTDIGHYLGLTVETVSRVFTRLQQGGLITARHKDIQLLDMPALHRQLENQSAHTDS